MAHSNFPLSIHCFGTLQIVLNGRALPAFDTDKTGALLAYLLLERQPLRRERLAALFWPEMDETRARANLSQALYLLRKAIPTDAAMPLLLTDARAVQMNPAFPLFCDATQLQQVARGCDQHQPLLHIGCEACLTALQPVGDLYRGELLAGLSLPNCVEFEEWLRTARQQYQRVTCAALQQLADGQQQRGDLTAALTTCHQWLTIDPLAEVGQHKLMMLLAQSDQHAAALATFENYRQRLQTELNAEPSVLITSLYRQLHNNLSILRQDSGQVSQSPHLPMMQTLHFVGRSVELAQLQRVLAQAVAGQGRALFVTGEAGFGKSALLQAFAEQAQAQFPALLVAGGNCNAYTGLGDPYLPLREILALLTGDTATQQQAGAITPVHMARLRALAPQAIAALIDVAPDLLGTFIAPTALLTRSAALIGEPAVRTQLQRLAAQKAREQTHGNAARPQTAIFEQVTKLLQRLAATAPLLLLVDDLQWADMGTISLLFHLARHLAHSPMLLVGAFRPSEVLAGNQSNGQRWATGAQHPLAALYYEAQRQWGEIEVALEAADGPIFVAALVDRQPNQLDATFRTRLHQYTHGNALFTVELLAAMQARGDLVRAADGHWLASTALDWETLPSRIEGVIAQRVARLPVDLRETLALASVMGENFQAEVLAGVQGVDRRQMVRWLSSELDRQHGLVTLQEITQIGTQTVARYRFRHILFQKYLYQQLDPAERTYLHGTVGTTLESLYRDHSDVLESLASELARHYEEAKQGLKAAEYFLTASRRALRFAVPTTAIMQANQGVELIGKLPVTTESMTVGLGLQICLGIAYTQHNGYESPAALHAYEQAAVLSTKVGDADELVALLNGLASTYRINARLRQSLEIGKQIVSLVEQQQNSKLVTLAYGTLGATLVNMGRLKEASHYLELAVKQSETEVTPVVTHMQATDPNVLALGYLAYAVVPLGYLDRARTLIEQALAIADKLAHPNSQAFALYFSIMVELMRRDVPAAIELLERLRALAKEQESINFWIRWTDPVVGWIAHDQGDLAKSLTLLRNWLPLRRTQGETNSPLTWQFATLCMALIKAGKIDEGLETISATLQLADRIDERWWEAELHRLHGELLLRRQDAERDPTGEAEESFQRAIEFAQSQHAKLWELRATVSLAQLLKRQGRALEAHTKLTTIYEWFTEGFDSYDLQKAKNILLSLAAEV